MKSKKKKIFWVKNSWVNKMAEFQKETCSLSESGWEYNKDSKSKKAKHNSKGLKFGYILDVIKYGITKTDSDKSC